MRSKRTIVSHGVLSVMCLFWAMAVAPSHLMPSCGPGMPEEKAFEEFDPGNFEHSTNIDNKWFPLEPGTQFVYEGSTVEDEEVVPHRVVFTVTDLIKVIGGVRTVVCWDRDYSAGEMVETEISFFAQDKDGTVWYLGEYPEEYEDGKFLKAPAWIHGFEGARAGIMMKAEPVPGMPSYSQGWAPAVDWTDRGEVHAVGRKISVPFGSYENVLVIDETNKEEPDAHQLKHYAPGVGCVFISWSGEGEQTRETLELVEVVQLTPEALAEARSEALKLEARAYKKSKNAYAHTPPAQRMLSTGDK